MSLQQLLRPRARAGRNFLFLAAMLGALLWGLAGCGSESTKPAKPVPLTLYAQGSGTSASAAAQATARYRFAAAAADTDTIPVTLTSVLLVVRDVRFVIADGGVTDTTSTTDSLDVGDDVEAGQVIFKGPFILNGLSGTAARLDTEMAPPGDYMRVQGHLQSLRASDPDAADFTALVGFTVFLEGTVDGEGGGPFTFQTRIDDEFMIRGGFHVEADRPATAFLTFDPTLWLKARDGHFLDPRNPDNELAIRQAIRHSIKIGMDDDHDGTMDDAMHQMAFE